MIVRPRVIKILTRGQATEWVLLLFETYGACLFDIDTQLCLKHAGSELKGDKQLALA